MSGKRNINDFYNRHHPLTIIFEDEYTILVWHDDFAYTNEILRYIVEEYNLNIHNNTFHKLEKDGKEFSINPKKLPNWGAKILVQKCRNIVYTLEWGFDLCGGWE